jgi:peptidoglycan/LPS O-acetylase OafA/YrhL
MNQGQMAVLVSDGDQECAEPRVAVREALPVRGKRAGATAQRRDLQGLRAVAVLLVVLAHARVPFMRGGYVGVDVFFVLSGYFITGLLLREGLNTGRISISKFYARRARRILPAAALTLVLTSVAVFVVYDLMRADFPDTKPTLQDSLTASLFYANIHFASAATNYFTQGMPSPVQHFWSLSVEEQFYLVWPSLVALVLLGCRGRGPHFDPVRAKRVLGLVVTVACMASLWWSIHDTWLSPQSAYFSTFDRAWELGFGAGLAMLATTAHALPQALRIPLGWIGAGMVLAAAVLFSNSTLFPGYAALLPVAGTAFMVLAGLRATRGGVDRVLAARPMAFIGDRSYTFYLWHFPVLIVVWQAAGRVLPVTDNLGLMVGAFALAVGTYRFYENPLRYAIFLRGWRTAAMVPVTIGIAVAAIVVMIFAFQASMPSYAYAATRNDIAPRLNTSSPNPAALWSAPPLPQVVAAERSVTRNAALPKPIVPSLSTLLAKETTHIAYDIPGGCDAGFGSGTTSNICRLGDPSSKIVVATFGDSHAQMWTPALIAAGKALGFAVVPIVKPGCLLGRLDTSTPGYPCDTWYQWALQQLKRLHPTATIVSFRLSQFLQQRDGVAVADLHTVLTSVPAPIYLADTPDNLPEPAQCLTRNGANMATCSAPEPSGYVPLMKDISGLVNQLHDPAIPTVQWFCANGICPTIINHTLVTHDGSHLTLEYSTGLAPLIGQQLQPILDTRMTATG